MLRGLRFSSTTLFLLSCFAGVAGATEFEFVPQEPAFREAVEEYEAIWASEGDRIGDALEEATGLRLEAGPIRAVVCECASYSGYRETPMQLRASYPGATKRATLVHELSHRLITDVTPESVDQHQVIFLFVYDVWVQLWGKEFGDAQVLVESRRRGYDYESAWRDALALGPAGRRERWLTLLKQWQQ